MRAAQRSLGPRTGSRIVSHTMLDDDLPATRPDDEALTARTPHGRGPAVGYPTSTVIGRYVVVRALGHGGMGMVMLAFDTQLGRRVALKVLHTHVASEEARVRLVREAQAMARLAHPNVIAGTAFLVIYPQYPFVFR